MGSMRKISDYKAVIANGAAVSDAIELSQFSGMIVQMPAAWTAASIGFKVCNTPDGTFLPLYDDDGLLVQIDSPAVDKAYSAPAPVFAAMYIQLWSQDGSASATNQGAARTLTVTMKA